MITLIKNNFYLSNLTSRKPKGFGLSPYGPLALMRYLANALTNGAFSYINPDHKHMSLLERKGHITYSVQNPSDKLSSIKVVFLGDIMTSKSGMPPILNPDVQRLLKTAHVIVANVESPVVNSTHLCKRGLSLKFEMNASFLKSIVQCNKTAQWVFNIANNHAGDTSTKDSQDESGIKTTIRSIKNDFPEAHIIGADIENAHSVLSLQIKDGPTIGFIGWTEIMNNDKKHYKKRIIRETDLSDATVKKIKEKHDLLIGFPHGNEEQSYHPLKETRDRWLTLMGATGFDVIVGHGPHVLQPAEKVGNSGLLFHSIGNFCSPVGRSQTKVGAIPELTINYSGRKLLATEYTLHLLQQSETLYFIQDSTPVPVPVPVPDVKCCPAKAKARAKARI